MAGLIVSAGLVGAELVLGLDSGEIINVGLVQGPRGLKGEPGPPGPRGEDGADGATLLNGEGPPRPELGKDGDWYIQVDATALWGPKVGGRWQGPVQLLSEAARRDRLGGPMQRRQGGPSAFFGGTGPTPAVQATPQQGLQPVIVNGAAVPAKTVVKIAEDDRGPLFDVDLRCESAKGMWTGTVRVGRYGSLSSHVVFGDFGLGTPPVITFTTSVANNKLALSMKSDVALTLVEGCEIILTR